jgi:hypothetical protein
METVNSVSYYTLTSPGAFGTKSATVNFVTSTANQQVTFTIMASSQANADKVCLGKLDSDDVSKVACMVSGNNVSSAHTFTVATPGAHYVKIFYTTAKCVNKIYNIEA